MHDKSYIVDNMVFFEQITDREAYETRDDLELQVIRDEIKIVEEDAAMSEDNETLEQELLDQEIQEMRQKMRRMGLTDITHLTR